MRKKIKIRKKLKCFFCRPCIACADEVKISSSPLYWALHYCNGFLLFFVVFFFFAFSRNVLRESSYFRMWRHFLTLIISTCPYPLLFFLVLYFYHRLRLNRFTFYVDSFFAKKRVSTFFILTGLLHTLIDNHEHNNINSIHTQRNEVNKNINHRMCKP